MSKRQVVIIGNGIAGITAARHIRKRSDHEITVISSETDHFFSRTALMYIYMGHMTFRDTQPYEPWFWEKNRIRLLRAHVENVDPAQKLLRLSGGNAMPYDDLILATGSKSNKFGWPGQDLHGVQGLYSYPDLELMEQNTRDVRRAVIVGGGLIGIETAEMLLSRDIPVTFLVREPAWMSFAFPAEESEMIGRHIREHLVDLRFSTEIESILADDRGHARAVTLKGGGEIDCEFVALTVGVSPNVDFLRESGIETDRGILVDGGLRTSQPDIYAIGDCAQLREPKPGRRPIEAVWYAGRRMGQVVARTLTGEPTSYDQGIWFNSAKFFDLEWQIYGDAPAQLPEDQSTLYWEDPGGKKSIRINYRTADRAVTGFNLMGIRYRHETCHQWLKEERPLDYVLTHLGTANFDPELFTQHEHELVALHNERFPDRPIRLKAKRGLRSLFAMGAAR